MTGATLAVMGWMGAGVIIGLNRASMYPGPQDALRWAGMWATVWPLLWLTEDR